MPDTITLLGSLAGLDLQAVVGQSVWVRVHYAPEGKLLGGTEPPGTVLGEPGYAPTGYGSARALVTDEQGLFGGVLPWEDGGIYRVDVPGDVTRYLMMGTDGGEHPAGSTVNVRMLPGPDGVVTPPLVALDTLIDQSVGEYLTAHPPTAVTDHGGLTGLGDDDHPHYLTAARGDLRYPLLTDARLTNSRTPTAHAASHTAGGSDALTLTAAQMSDLTETVQDIVGALIVAGSGVTVSYNDTAGTFTINSTAGGGSTDPEIVRDVIGTAMVAGAGIQITVNDAGDTITVSSTAVLPTRQVIAGTGLTGGGDLSADRTLAVAYGTTAGTSVQGNDARVVNAIQGTLVDAKGDLIAATADDTVARLPVGSNGQVLTADSTQATGLKWAAPAGGITYGTTTFADAQLNPGNGSFVSVADRIGAAFLPTPYAITSIRVSVNTAVSGATGDLVLYTRSDGTFTRHTNFGSIGLSTTGLKTLTGSWTLPAGEFWIGVLGTSAATGANLVGMPIPNGVPIPTRDHNNMGAVAVVGFTAGAGAVPPATFTTPNFASYWQGNPPAIFFRGGPA